MAINMQGTNWEPMLFPAPAQPEEKKARRGSGIMDLLGPVKPYVDLRAADYERAAEIMRERGFAKGTGQDDDGNVCTGGAMAWAVYERMGGEDVRVDLMKMAKEMDLDEFAVPFWNDAPGRTQEEVIDRLEQTAKKLRNEGR